ncbi:prepilin-type N-terminal cleavage/methylation domain-containing protein [Patescibacteria group bacterium]|nr:prepilin-type N-terminal cleavage/methylation domain-containing protein [Patescibacteria group bacterium]
MNILIKRFGRKLKAGTQNLEPRAGFTLIELIIYIALVSIFISGAILFAWDIIYGRVKSGVQREVTQNLRLASKRLVYEIRNASGINSVSTSTISLVMDESDRNPTVFDVSGGRLRIGYGSGGSCPSTSPCSLTSNKVTVSNLAFTDLSSSGGESVNIQFTIALESNNPSGRQEWEKSQTYTTSVELRSN